MADLTAKSQARKRTSLSIQPMLSFTGDEKNIRKLISILLDNALKYSPGGKIELRLEKGAYPPADRVQYRRGGRWSGKSSPSLRSVLPDGPVRNSQTGGYGLGLSIARSIVVAHKGKIRAESPDGTTLSVVVLLPR